MAATPSNPKTSSSSSEESRLRRRSKDKESLKVRKSSRSDGKSRRRKHRSSSSPSSSNEDYSSSDSEHQSSHRSKKHKSSDRSKKSKDKGKSRRHKHHKSKSEESSSRGSTHGWSNLPDDGCPYYKLTPGAMWMGKYVLFPNGPTKFWPAGAYNILSKIIKSKREIPGGEKWSTISDKMKAEYFDELGKHYFIPSALLPRLWSVFETLGSELYKKKIRKVKLSGKRPEWIGVEEWGHWVDYWNRKADRVVAAQSTMNQLTESSDGTGVARHHFGPQVVFTPHLLAEKSALQLFKRANLKNGIWVDSWFEEIAAEVERRIGGREMSIREENDIFLAVNPMNDKGQVYGLGSLGALAAPSSSVSQECREPIYTAAEVQELINPLQEELAKSKEKFRQLFEYMQKQVADYKRLIDGQDLLVQQMADMKADMKRKIGHR